MISLDTETTGLNLRHGCRPHFVAAFDGNRATFWEWRVDPLTRAVAVPDEDKAEIAGLLAGAGGVVGHNVKFDATALLTAGVVREWPWDRTEDTLLAGHLLESALPHDLTSMVLRWLDETIQPLEDRLKETVLHWRRRVQQARLARKRGKPKEDPREDALADWRMAAEGEPDQPSAGKEPWKADAWLPLVAAECFRLPADAPDRTACRDYALGDVESTWHLWQEVRAELDRRGQFAMYRERTKSLRWLFGMEQRGTTVDRTVLREVRKECALEAGRAERECLEVAAARGCALELPKAGRNGSLDRFLFGWGVARCGTCGREQEVRADRVGRINETRPPCNFCREDGKAGEVTAEGDPGLNLEPVRNPDAKTDRPAFDAKVAIPHYLATLPPDSDALRFVRAFERRGHANKAASYCDSYEEFGVPVFGTAGWLVLHPNYNAAGTQLLRRSCNDPNLQNVGKKKQGNLRRAFGPAPGREWWSLDYKNIELRIPAYEANERELIDLFERPDDPPYYGSEHLINFHTVYPDVWDDALARLTAELGSRELALARVGPWVKKEYEDTWYQWCKNGDFAVGYQAGDATADRAFHRPGSRARLRSRFARKDALNERITRFAVRHGYVETLPDREVSPDCGYRLMVTRTDRGDVLSTVPLNFHVQGTAGWIQTKSINRCGPVLADWTREDPRGYYMILEVHDELVFDFPAGEGPEPWRTNVGKVRVLQRLMEQGGEDVGVPTPVDVEWCPVSWADGKTIKRGAEDAPVKLRGPAAFAAKRRMTLAASSAQTPASIGGL